MILQNPFEMFQKLFKSKANLRKPFDDILNLNRKKGKFDVNQLINNIERLEEANDSAKSLEVV